VRKGGRKEEKKEESKEAGRKKERKEGRKDKRKEERKGGRKEGRKEGRQAECLCVVFHMTQSQRLVGHRPARRVKPSGLLLPLHTPNQFRTKETLD